MILNYDRNPVLTTDQKLLSLIESMQRALDEANNKIADLEKRIEKLEEGAD